jgi:hypothetical protein
VREARQSTNHINHNFSIVKKCSKCGDVKELIHFHKDKSKKDLLRPDCKSCSNAIQRSYVNRNYDVVVEQKKNRYLNNKESILAKAKDKYDQNKEDKLASNKIYYNKNKSSIMKQRNIYQLNKRNSDPIFRTICNLRSRLSRFCNSIVEEKTFKTLDSIGLNKSEFKEYIESMFVDGMSWNNYGKGDDKWSIDHIKPLCTAKTEEDVFILNHYTNLQPMWNPQNFSKGGKWDLY